MDLEHQIRMIFEGSCTFINTYAFKHINVHVNKHTQTLHCIYLPSASRISTTEKFVSTNLPGWLLACIIWPCSSPTT